MKKENTLRAFILTAILFLNSGCFSGYFVSKKIETPKKIQPITEQVKESKILSAPTSVSVECTDNINSPCQKAPIPKKALKPRTINKQGEIHKLRSIQGKPITIIEGKTGFFFPQYKNKVVILELFGKDCSHCIKEMPIMRRIYKKYQNKLKIIAVQVEDKMTSREAKRLLQQHRIKYPIISGDTATNLQYNIQSTYGWTGILPYILVIKNGVTEFTYPGEVAYKEINRDIRSLL